MKREFIPLAVLPFAVLCAFQAQAVELATGEVTELAPFVVSATRTPNRLDHLPASVSQVTAQDFEASQAYVVSDVMKRLPNVDFGGGPRPAAQIPTIRGYSGREITVLVDGARINDASSLSSPIHIDPYQLAAVEVVRGSTSSLYGSGGLGGVMAFRTVSARDLLADGQSTGADMRAGFASADLSQHYNARAYGQSGTFDALVSIGYADWGRIRQGGGDYLKPNDGHADNGLLKFGYQPNDRLRLQLSYQSYEENSLRPNNPQTDSSLGTPSSIPVQANRTRQDQAIFKLTSLDETGANDIDVTLYQTRLKRSAQKNPAFPALAATNSETETLGASIQDTLRFEGAGVGHRLTYGVDYYEDKQSAASSGSPNPVIPNGRQEVYGLFMQDEIALGEAWRLTPSLRADRYRTSADNSNSDSSDSHVSPKLSLAWQASPSTRVYASYGEAFRAPSLTEMYTSLSGRNYLFNFAPNTNLKPETDRTFEMGAAYTQGSVLAAEDSLRIKISAFVSRVSDLISNTVIGSYIRTAPFAGRGVIQQAQNIQDARRTGGEIELRYKKGLLEFNAAYSRIRVVDANRDANLFSPPDSLNLQLKQALGSTSVTLMWNGRFVAAQDYDATVLRRTAGYGVNDVYLSWSPEWARKSRIDFSIGNVFDQRYISYQSSNVYAKTVETGRNVKIAFSSAF